MFIWFLPTLITDTRKGLIDDQKTLFLDACLTGKGAKWRNSVYATLVLEIPDFNLNITHLEMFDIVIVVRPILET